VNARVLMGRLGQSVLVIWVVITASFFIMKAAPGSPLAEDRQLPADVEQMLMERYHLDEPVWVQYGLYLSGLFRGDLGPSIKQGAPVSEILTSALPYSLILGAQALLFALVVGVPLGLVAGWRHRSLLDHGAMAVAMAGVSIPNFVLAPLLIMVFSVGLGWFASGDWNQWSDSVLPSVSLGMYYTAYVGRLTRSGMLEVIRQDYIRTARAKGLGEMMVVFKHALRASILPVVSYLGPAAASVLTGSVVIEKVFNVPGLGTFFVDAAFNRDYFLVLGVLIVYSALLVVLNLVVDTLYGILDPRVRDGE
jgi:oligopeptide transport system permease protein